MLRKDDSVQWCSFLVATFCCVFMNAQVTTRETTTAYTSYRTTSNSSSAFDISIATITSPCSGCGVMSTTFRVNDFQSHGYYDSSRSSSLTTGGHNIKELCNELLIWSMSTWYTINMSLNIYCSTNTNDFVYVVHLVLLRDTVQMSFLASYVCRVIRNVCDRHILVSEVT